LVIDGHDCPQRERKCMKRHASDKDAHADISVRMK
jgi:hypothetical protein